jgi:hypothetical protein
LLRIEQLESRDLVPIREQPPPPSLDTRIDEEPVLVDQSGLDQRMGQGDAARDDDVLAVVLLEGAISSMGSPESTVVFSHCVSVSVEDTTYFCTRFR